jgi:hypothetical protein
MFKTDAQVDEWRRGIAEAQKLGPDAVAAFLRDGNLPTWPKEAATVGFHKAWALFTRLHVVVRHVCVHFWRVPGRRSAGVTSAGLATSLYKGFGSAT